LTVAVALAQIGEFSLILATVGDQLAILPKGATNAIVAASIITIMLNPLLYRLIRPMEAALAGRFRLWRLLNSKQQSLDMPGMDDPPATMRYRAVVVGYGPIGKTVARLLRDGGIEPVIIETNIETVRHVREVGYRVLYGDAGNQEILDGAGIRNAVALVISGPTSDQGTEIIRIARRMNPNLQVLARSYYLKETVAMRQAGANEVFSGEGEVALAMTEYILRLLGSPPEQMDRERQRVREEVFRVPMDREK
jgi:CPA2 family monovalent cation:H+ antiporter-2